MARRAFTPCQANAENLFSSAGKLSDPNMDPHYLGVLSSIAINKKAYKPSVAAIKEKYFAKFRGASSSGGASSSMDAELEGTL